MDGWLRVNLKMIYFMSNKEFLKVINNKVKQFEREDLKKSFKVLKGGKDVKVVFLNKKLK